jgi:hypothetical protein
LKNLLSDLGTHRGGHITQIGIFLLPTATLALELVFKELGMVAFGTSSNCRLILVGTLSKRMRTVTTMAFMTTAKNFSGLLAFRSLGVLLKGTLSLASEGISHERLANLTSN